jgi:hypothetical protein
MRMVALLSSGFAFGLRGMSGSAPDSAVTFFCFAKRKSPKKRRAECVAPSLRYGYAALLGLGGVRANSPAAQTRAPLIRPVLRYSPTHNGGEPGTDLDAVVQSDTLFKLNAQNIYYKKSSYLRPPRLRKRHFSSQIFAPPGAERSKGVFSPLPFCMRRGAQLGADQGRACLSEASLHAPRLKRAPQVARSAAEGRRQQGRLFFAYFLLATQKKVSRPPGRDPACHASEAGQKEIKQC